MRRRTETYSRLFRDVVQALYGSSPSDSEMVETLASMKRNGRYIWTVEQLEEAYHIIRCNSHSRTDLDIYLGGEG